MSGKRIGHRRESVRDELLHKAQDLFALCDTENKGFATKRDMLKLQGQLALSPEQLDEVFEALDNDGNGCLTLEEFRDGFGMFLGVDTETWNNTDSDLQMRNHKKTSSEGVENDDLFDTEADDEQFEEFLDQLGAHNVFRDEDYIRKMWDQVKRHDPSMVNNFEDFLGKITHELKNTKKEYSSLESTLKNRNNLHDQQVQLLYMEMEEQLQSEKEHLLAQERMNEKKVKDEMESELQLKDQQLHELLLKHSEMEKQLQELNSDEVLTKHENVKLQKERDVLEMRLEASERMLNDMNKHLNELRRRSLDERRKRAQAALKVSEGIALERENLVTQLQILQQVNKQLLDEKDELMLSANSTPFCRSPENSSSPGCCGQHMSDAVVEDAKLKPDILMAVQSSPDNTDQTRGSHFTPCRSTNSSPAESPVSLESTGEIAILQQKEMFAEALSIKTSTPSPLLSQTLTTETLQNPLLQKFDDDCEVDDCFFESEPHFLGVIQEGNVSKQNDLNTAIQTGAIDEQSNASDESNENVLGKRMNSRRKSSAEYHGRKSSSPSLQKEGHGLSKKSASISSNSSKGTQSDARSPERIFKVVFVGDSGVGKTSLIHRFCNETFRPTFSATIGVDFQVKTIQVQDRLVALQLWDTAGQERFRSLTKQYFRKADGIIVVYDVTSETSFKNIRNWIFQIQEYTDEHIVMMVIGNKLDLCEDDSDRVIKRKDGSWLADEFGCLFFETSAKTGKAVQESIYALSCLLQEREDEVIEKVLKLQETLKRQKKCC